MEFNRSKSYACRHNETKVETFKLATLGYICFEILLGLFIGFGNVLVVVAISKFQELRTNMNIYVFSLAIADLAVSVITLPLHIAIFAFPHLKSVLYVCISRYCILIISNGASAMTLLLITIDRYIAIEKPLDYRRVMTTGKAKLLSLGVWILTLSFGFLPLFGWNEWSPCSQCTSTLVLPYVYLTLIVFIIILSVIFVWILNIRIFLIANKATRDIQKQMASFPCQPSTRITSSFLQNRRAWKALLLMSGAFTICLLPFGLFILWEINSVDNATRKHYHVLRIATIFLCIANSGLNPVIYHNRISEFNRAFRKLLGMKGKKSQMIHPSSSE